MLATPCYIYIYIPGTPMTSIYWKVNPPKQGLFQQKQGSFRFQVSIYNISSINTLLNKKGRASWTIWDVWGNWKLMQAAWSLVIPSSFLYKWFQLHPAKWTAGSPKENEVWKMIFLFNWLMFRFHVNFPGCIFKDALPLIAEDSHFDKYSWNGWFNHLV